MKVGDKIKMRTSHSDGSEVIFSAKVVAVTDTSYTVRIPDKVRRLPFPPMGKNPKTGVGWKFVTYKRGPHNWSTFSKCHCMKNAEGAIEEASGTCPEHGGNNK